MKIIDRYILKSHLLPFGYAFLTIVFMLILQFFSIFADRLIGKGMGFATILELIFLQSAWMIGLAIPMAVLVAVVLTFGALTTTSEVTVFRATGISLYRLMAPVLIAGLFLSGLVERFNNVIVPVANYYARTLMLEIARSKPEFGLEENAFSKLVDGYSIFVRDSDKKSKELRGIVIYDYTNPDFSIMVTAEKGTLEFSPDYHYLMMTLFNGEIHEMKHGDLSYYRKIGFEKDRFIVESSKLDLTGNVKKRIRSGDNELSADELLFINNELRVRIAASERMIEHLKGKNGLDLHAGRKPAVIKGEAVVAQLKTGDSGVSASDQKDGKDSLIAVEKRNLESSRRMLNRYIVSYHKKYALSFSCFVFILVGAPLGVMARKGGFGLGAAVSLLLFVLYWVLMLFGESIAEYGLIGPFISVWFPNFILTAIGILLAVRLNGPVFRSMR
ncbi:MAG: YjgP/YjgQ family permease [Chlorobiaceae bacterium]|nr:YjgP/YjgQ family permease [Chlorobiaceae bacterium]